MKLIILTAVVALLGMPAVSAGAPLPYDLDGDGRQELVVGLPVWFEGQKRFYGVAVLNGTAGTLVGRPRVITWESLGIPGEQTGTFGRALASGDFDGDGRADLAIGSPGSAEAVVVVYGADGFPGARVEVVDGPPARADGRPLYSGSLLVAGDLNGDGFDDLVVGASSSREPAFHIVFGGADGFGDAAPRAIERPDNARDFWGEKTLALGDASGDGHPDVFEGSIGRPTPYDARPLPGYLTMLAGTADGPTRARAVRPRLRGGPASLAVGDVTGDGYEDVVAGVPRNRYADTSKRSSRLPAGAVRIWRGGPDGPSGKPIVIDQETVRIPGRNRPGDEFGAAVAVGQLDRDRYADVVVGVPGKGGKLGRVVVVRGGPRGHAKNGHRAFVPGKRGLPRKGWRRGVPLSRWTYRFGGALSLLDHDGDGRLDLSVGERTHHGAVTVIAGAKRGFFATDRTRRFQVSRLGLKQHDMSEMQLGRVGSS